MGRREAVVIFSVIFFHGANKARGWAKKGQIKDKARFKHIGQIKDERGGC